MGIKDIYNDLELKYYNVVDKITQKIPFVGTIVDSIDNVVPSFALVIALTILITIGVVLTRRYFCALFCIRR